MGVSMKSEVLRKSLNAVIGRGTDTSLCDSPHKPFKSIQEIKYTVSTIIQKTRILQNNLLYNHRFKKQLQQRSYRAFLQQNNGYLPSLKTLEKWRKRLLYASFLCLCPICLGTVINGPWVYSDLLPMPYEITGVCSPAILFGCIFLILLSFSVMFDRVIYKRRGYGTFIDWQPYRIDEVFSRQ